MKGCETLKEQIINILKNSNGNSYYEQDFIKMLNITDSQKEQELQKKLKELTDDATLYKSEKKNKYCLFQDSHLLKGVVDLTNKGDAYIIIDGESEDIFVSKKDLNGALNEDTVAIKLLRRKEKGRKKGQVVKIIKRKKDFLIGEIYNINGIFKVKEIGKMKKPDIDLTIEIANLGNAVDGSIVKISLNNSKNGVYGKIEEIIGHKNNPMDDIKSYIYKYNFDIEFSKETNEEINQIPAFLSEEEIKKELENGRIDLTEEIITTMDGADTKDIDDAISIKKLENNNYLLGVHIADVSHYVKQNSYIDEDAKKRTTSNYFPGGSIPMLPQKLSNGICSLNPKEERLATSCYMEIDNKGKVVNHIWFESIIKSRLKMTYEKVNEILENDVSNYDHNIKTKTNDNENEEQTYQNLTNDLKLMRELSTILRKMKIERGYIEFESNECKITTNNLGVPTKVERHIQKTGEKIIEDFMIARNETIAQTLFQNNLQGFYRIHGKPEPEKLQNFINFLEARGISIKGANITKWTNKDFQNLINNLKMREDGMVLSDMAVRVQTKAKYSENNIGHYGLGSKCYSHDTSPIRRYPDLTQHRIMKDFAPYLYDPNEIRKTLINWQIPLGKTILEENKFIIKKQDKDFESKKIKWTLEVPELAIHCSERERQADELERDIEKMKKCEYMEDKIGTCYDVMISGITTFGVFVALENTIEGMIKYEDLPKDSYHYDEKTQILYGTKTGRKYQIGDKLYVKLINASKESQIIDFIPVEKEKTKEI